MKRLSPFILTGACVSLAAAFGISHTVRAVAAPAELSGDFEDMSSLSVPSGTPLLTAAIISDIHYSLAAPSSISLNPLWNQICELTDAFAAQVIDLHPDVLILCGDNTNSGRKPDMFSLAGILRHVHQAGIEVIAITGNHDFDHSTPEAFASEFTDLCRVDERDPDSLSFSLTFPFPENEEGEPSGLRLLAMDDNTLTDGVAGKFSEETMAWLEKQLQNARENQEEVVFISHHNVLPGGEAAVNNRYQIQNTNLRDLLLEYHVRLCLTGHRHSQEIMQYDTMYEIISATPSASPYYFGMLEFYADHVDYEARSIDFSYDRSNTLAAKAQEAQENSLNNVRKIMSTADQSMLSESALAKAASLFQAFFNYYSEGSLALHIKEFLGNPVYEDLQAVIGQTNYGPWVDYALHTDILPANRLSFRLSNDD